MAAKSNPVNIEDPAIPKGSWILITGVNGLIASHTADQLLAAGYKVRGTVRSVERTKWLFDLFAPYGKYNFALEEVPDMTADGAFDNAVKGVAGVIHTATPTSLDPDPNLTVPIAINAVKVIAKSIEAAPEVKRFVLTSSSTAAYAPTRNKSGHITTDTWNDEAVKHAWAPPPFTKDSAYAVYSASKTQGEQEFWKWGREFAKKERPDLTLNAVLPNANLGVVLDVKNQGFPSTIGFFKPIYDGKLDEFILDPQYHVDVQDDAKVHVAALLLKEVKDERLFAFAELFDVNSALAAFRKASPNKKFLEDIENVDKHLFTVPNERAEELLKKISGKGWVSLEDSIKAMVETAYEKAT